MPSAVLRFFLLLIGAALSTRGQEIWSARGPGFADPDSHQPVAVRYFIFHCDTVALTKQLFSVGESPEQPQQIMLPAPNGIMARFMLSETAVMDKDLSAAFPRIRSYNVKGIDDPYATGKIDWNEFGFHGMVISPRGDFFIEPLPAQPQTVRSYYRKDYVLENRPFSEPDADQLFPATAALRSETSRAYHPCIGNNLRIFRLAVACTHKYAQAATGETDPTLSQALSKIVVTVNRVNSVFERDAAIRLVLAATSTAAIFTSANADPFPANASLMTMTQHSQKVIDSLVGDSNYDVGHTFATSGGGLAYVEGLCTPLLKAHAVTGSSNPAGDPFDIDYVAHELGHQFGARHTFNAVTGSCGGNRASKSAVEPGSGITVMSYAGICTGNNLGTNSIPYFHPASYDEIVNFAILVSSKGCGTTESISNKIPVVTALPERVVIPRGTPFRLSGKAADPDGDKITYSWEEVTRAPQAASWNADIKPYFRSYSPDTVPYRYFPSRSVARTGNVTGVPGEYLSNVPQRLAFRLTVRDNHPGGGGVCSDSTIVEMAAAGPFSVMVPSSPGIIWEQGMPQVVCWDVSATNVSPVNCHSVSILFSSDSGRTYTPLLINTPNDGYESVTMPAINNTADHCRIMIGSSDHTFYDESNNDFTLTTEKITSAAGNQILPMFTVWPVPASETVGFSAGLSGLKLSVMLLDVTGRVIALREFMPFEPVAGVFQTSTLSPGIYFVRMESGPASVTRKVAKI